MKYLAQLLQDGLIYENNEIYIKYYNDKQFNKYRANSTILGEISLENSDPIDDINDFIIVTSKTGEYSFKINPINQKNSTLGYIYVGESKFVKLITPITKKSEKCKKSKLPFILIPIILITLGIGGYFVFNSMQKEKPDGPGTMQPQIEPEIEEILNVSNTETEIPLYVSFNITSDETINLRNPKSNTVVFKYEIIEDGKKIYTTNDIMPNNVETIKIGDYLSVGEHNVIFKIRCFYNGNEVNGTEEPVNIIIN